MYQLHVLARPCRGHPRDRFQEEPIGCCLGKLYKDKIPLVGDRELLWVCLISAIQPEVVTGGFWADRRIQTTEMFEQAPTAN
jgi:hypothetical protein